MDKLDRAIRCLKFSVIALSVVVTIYIGVRVYLLATGRG